MPEGNQKSGHLITILRILKCIEVICGILITIGIQCSWATYLHHGVFVTIVSSIGAVTSAILLGLHLFRKADRLVKLEFAFYALWTILYLIATIITARFDMARVVTSYQSLIIQKDGKASISDMPQGLTYAAFKIMGETVDPGTTKVISFSAKDWQKVYVETSSDVGSDMAILFGAVATVVYVIDAFLLLIAIR